MRVALVCPYAWDAPGGVQIHVAQLARRLLDRGHEVLVLAPGSNSAVDPWVRVVGAPVRVPYRGTVAPICFTPASARRVRTALGAFAPDVVHAHEPLTPSTSMQAVRAATAPVVATFHANLGRSRLMEVAAPVLRGVYRRIDAAIAVSDAAASFLARAIPERAVRVVPNGVDTRPFAAGVRPSEGLPDGRILLWVNRLDPQKGFPIAVAAFERLAARFPDLSFVVAGDGKDRDAVHALAEPIRRRVLLLGRVPHAEVPAYLASADAFVSPATGQESFGIVLVEAMAAGVPVVATDIAGYREVVRDGIDGLLVRSGDPEVLAEALGRVLEEPDLASRLSAAGRERASGFDWDQVAPRIEAVYREVTQGA